MKWNALSDKTEWLLKKITEHTEEPIDDNMLKQLADKLQEKGYVSKKLREQQRFNYLKAYQQVVQPRKRWVSPGLLKIAAAIIILIGTGTFLYFQQLPELTPTPDELFLTEVHPGTRKAFLIKHDGLEIELKGDSVKIDEQNGINIHIDSMGLRYDTEQAQQQTATLYNTLVVPRGGEYSLVLADGTKVWLNADSELRYPIQFTGNTREVSVVGEAVFEVTKQEGKPFIVKTSLGNITVLGTQFNVCNYPGKEKLVTTLVQGKVSCVLPNGKSIVLAPDQQLSINGNGESKLRTVDTKYFTCWKDGMFLFEEMRMEDILEQLSRWYDIHIFYTNEEVKDLHFSGDLSRFKDIITFIEMFEKSADVKLTLKGNTLTVGL